MSKKSESCPILSDLYGIDEANSGCSNTGKDPTDNWIKKICEECPLQEKCIYMGGTFKVNKEFVRNLIRYIKNVLEEKNESRG